MGARTDTATSMIQEVRFDSEEVSCAATLHLPPGLTRPAPGVVMGNGFASVRQMYLPEYARAFADAGFAVLTIDYRFLGGSDGQPRQQVLPSAQCDDLRNALTWLGQHPWVDADRLALWGTSFAGGHALRIAAIDRRVRAVVAQVPAVGLWRYLRLAGDEVAAAFRQRALAERLRYHASGQVRDIAITAPPGEDSVLGPDGYDWHRTNESRHTTFHNRIAAHSLDACLDYDPAVFVDEISPTPLLMLLADADTTTPSEIALSAYHRAKQPKQLVTFPGCHYDVYDNDSVKRQVITATTDFLREHLHDEGRTPPAM